jgi:hypothetical protein
MSVLSSSQCCSCNSFTRYIMKHGPEYIQSGPDNFTLKASTRLRLQYVGVRRSTMMTGRGWESSCKFEISTLWISTCRYNAVLEKYSNYITATKCNVTKKPKEAGALFSISPSTLAHWLHSNRLVTFYHTHFSLPLPLLYPKFGEVAQQQQQQKIQFWICN